MSNAPKKQSSTQLVNLAPEEVQALARPREGFEAYVPTLFDLYAENPAELSVKGLDIDATRQELDEYVALVAAEKEAEEKLAMIKKTRMLKGSNVWRAALAIYRRAESAAASNPAYLRAIAAFAKFMKHARKPKASAPTPTTCAPSTSSNGANGNGSST